MPPAGGDGGRRFRPTPTGLSRPADPSPGRGRPIGSTRRATRGRRHSRPRPRRAHARAPRGRGASPFARRPGRRVDDREAGPAHVATLKTFDPPLLCARRTSLRGRTAAGQAPALPDDENELVLHVHLMSAGRLGYATPGGKDAEDTGLPPDRSRTAASCPDRGRARRSAPAWASTRPRPSRPSSRISGPERSARRRPASRQILAARRGGSIRCCAISGRSRASVGPGRTRSCITLASPLRALDELAHEEIEQLWRPRSTRSSRGASSCASAASRRKKVYRIHDRLGQPCPVAAHRSRGSTSRSTPSTTAPQCQTGGRVLKDAAVAAACR